MFVIPSVNFIEQIKVKKKKKLQLAMVNNMLRGRRRAVGKNDKLANYFVAASRSIGLDREKQYRHTMRGQTISF